MFISCVLVCRRPEQPYKEHVDPCELYDRISSVEHRSRQLCLNCRDHIVLRFMNGMSSGDGGFKFSFGTASSREESEAGDPRQQALNAAEEVFPADAPTVCPN